MPDCDCSNACPPFIRSSFGVELLRILSHMKTFLYWSSFTKSTVENSPDSPSLQIKEWRSTARTRSGAPVSARNQRQSAILPETRDSHIHPSTSTPALLHHGRADQHLITAQITNRVRGNKPRRRLPSKTDPLNSSSLCCIPSFFFSSLNGVALNSLLNHHEVNNWVNLCCFLLIFSLKGYPTEDLWILMYRCTGAGSYCVGFINIST